MTQPWWRGRVLQQIRKRRKLTQLALAEKVGVHKITISRLERGDRQPSMDMLQKLAKVLKVNMKDLLP